MVSVRLPFRLDEAGRELGGNIVVADKLALQFSLGELSEPRRADQCHRATLRVVTDQRAGVLALLPLLPCQAR